MNYFAGHESTFSVFLLLMLVVVAAGIFIFGYAAKKTRKIQSKSIEVVGRLTELSNEVKDIKSAEVQHRVLEVSNSLIHLYNQADSIPGYPRGKLVKELDYFIKTSFKRAVYLYSQDNDEERLNSYLKGVADAAEESIDKLKGYKHGQDMDWLFLR